MLFVVAVLYVAIICLRPTEVIGALQGFPLVMVASALALPRLGLDVLNEPRRLWTLPNDRYLFGYWLAIVVSCLAWGWLGGAIESAERFGQVVFMYVLLRYAVRTGRQFETMLGLVLILLTVQATSGIIQWWFGAGLGGVEAMRMGGVRRIQGVGIFNDPNDLALALVTVVPAMLVALLDGRRKGSRIWVAGLGLPVVLAAVYLSNSRGGIVALCAGVVGLSALRWGRLAAATVALVGIPVVLMLGPSRLDRMASDEASAQGRIEAWAEGLQMFKSRPIFGVAWSRFSDLHDQVAHNSFVHALAELGLVGAFFFVGFVYWFFKTLALVRGRPPSPPGDIDWSDALLAGGLTLVTGASFLSRQYDPAFFLFLTLGVCYASLRGAAGALDARPPGAALLERLLVAGLVILGIVLTYGLVLLLGAW